MKTSRISQVTGSDEMPNQLASYLEVIRAAQRQEHFEDFKTGGRLTGDVRHGYQARMVAFAELLDKGLVKLESGFLSLGFLSELSWLNDAVLDGDKTAWDICDAFPQRQRKFQPDLLNLEEIGQQGEDFVISLLKEKIAHERHSEIVHTSLVDDSAGYDISAPNTRHGGKVLLEVKTTTRPTEDFTFHLSRNEWSTATRHSNWYLVLVQKVQGKLTLYGYLDGGSLVHYYPRDNHEDFQWTSTVGKLGPDDVFDGLPGIY